MLPTGCPNRIFQDYYLCVVSMDSTLTMQHMQRQSYDHPVLPVTLTWLENNHPVNGLYNPTWK